MSTTTRSGSERSSPCGGEPDETLHLDGCVLPGGHEGDCKRRLQINPDALKVTHIPRCRRCRQSVNLCRCGMLGADVDEDLPTQ